MSTADLNRILIISLYLPMCLLVYKRLFPRLSPVSKRLATFMLVAQVLVIALSMELNYQNGIQRWLWNLDGEYNIPATLASSQLALIGVVALLTGWHSKARSPWQRLYFAGLGVLFIHLARDEFFLFHEDGLRWQFPFAQFGAALAMATALSAFRLPRSLRIWHLCILAGLAIGALGALALDVVQWNGACNSTVFFSGRCEIYILEEMLEFLGMWLVLIGVCGLFSAAAPRLNRRWQLVILLPALWAITHHIPYLINLAELSSITSPSSVFYTDDSLELRIYRIEKDQNEVKLQFFALPQTWHHYTGMGYSLHLVDQVSGASYVGVDDSGRRNHLIPYRIFGERYTYKQWLGFDIPPTVPRNRALWLLLTTWQEQEQVFLRQSIISSDFPLLDDSQVILGELVVQEMDGPSASSPVAFFENGLSLDLAEMPSRAHAGEILSIRFAWTSEQTTMEDYAQFLHFGHELSGDWWVYDQEPLGARLPSRLWYSGLTDSEIWQIRLTAELEAGRYLLFTGLYRSSDRERLPAIAADGTPFVDARVPLGSLIITTSD